MRRFLSRIFLLAAVLLPSAALAKVDVKIDVGWNGAFRAGRWGPVYITMADDQANPARNVIVQIVAPHDKTFGLRIFTAATIRGDPSTNLVYVPLTAQLDETIAIIRDADSNKTLAEVPFKPSSPDGRLGMLYYGTGQNQILLGVSGTAQHGLSPLLGQFKWTSEAETSTTNNGMQTMPPDIQIGYLEPRMLPDAKVGYECLDALVLAAPDLVNLAPQRQEAIATWIKSGGRLIFWAGDGIIPADSPIVKLLPCEIGVPETIKLSVDDTKKAGLLSRLEQLPSRAITPLPSAQKLDLLGGKAAAYTTRAGEGQVTLLSLDASKLNFNDPTDARKFWRPIFHRTLKSREEPSTNTTRNPYYYNSGIDAWETRRIAATERIIDRLGDVPGVGRFDFSYVALVMIALMFIVGPIDWFVLRKLGRQQWTWVTTGGWIALITFAALYVGHVLKSGDLYYRTVRVVDQADDQVVGVLDVAGIYSPKTQAYNLDGPRESWWEPANVDFQPYRQSTRISSEIAMMQDRLGQKLLTRYDRNGNRIPSMMINVWNLRFMQSELGNPTAEPPVISCDLKVVKNRIQGTITNRTNIPLANVFIATKVGETLKDAFSLAAGQTMNVDFAINPTGTKEVDVSQYSPYYYYGANQRNPYSAMTDDVGFISAAADMASDRGARIFELLSKRDDMACVYALMNSPPPAVKLEHEGKMQAIEQHWQVIRALVQLGK